MNLRLASSVLAALALSTPAAAAPPARPVPGCAGMALTDPTGDHLSPAGPGTRPYLDVEGLFFRSDPGHVTANIVIAELSLGIDPGSNPRAAVIWQAAGAYRFVRAAGGVVDGGLFFQHGDFDPVLKTFSVAGEIAGTFFEGTHGVIALDLPAAAGVVPGATLGQSYVESYEGSGSALGDPIVQDSDRAPDSGSGPDYVVGACSDAPPAPGSAIQPASAGPAGTGTPAPPATLPVGLAGPRPRARGGRLWLSLHGQARGLDATLLRGSTVVGRGRLARLAGRGSVTLRLTGRLRRGAYVLRLSGTRDDGRLASRKLHLKLR